MKPISDKRRAQLAERKRLRDHQLSVRPLCEAKIDGICQNRATDVHEIINRSQRSTSWLEPDLFVSLCRHCHSYATTHPLWARKHGLSLPSWSHDIDVIRAQSVRGFCKDRACTTDHMDRMNS